MRALILAGDVGATKTDLALFDCRDDNRMPDMVEHRRFLSRDHAGLAAVLLAWRQGRVTLVGAAAFGVAGPIVGGRVETTNLPWVIDRSGLEELLGCPVALINDLEAMALGVCALRDEDLLILNEGQQVERGARAVIAAGSGLGEAYMVYDRSAGAYVAQPSEGGHCDFSARTPEEIDLMLALAARHGRVSVERVVSGPGVEAIFAHLASSGRYAASPPANRGVTAAEISAAAIAGSPPICVESMRLFVSAYGAEAGNLALKIMALGGLYVGGGIAPKILPLMAGGDFMRAFTDKGRFGSLMRSIPVRVALNERTSLIGASLVASRMAGAAGPRPSGMP